MAVSLRQHILRLESWRTGGGKRLDKIEEEVKLLRKEFRAYVRAPMSKSGTKVPPTALPDTLDKLELGKTPEGT